MTPKLEDEDGFACRCRGSNRQCSTCDGYGWIDGETHNPNSYLLLLENENSTNYSDLTLEFNSEIDKGWVYVISTETHDLLKIGFTNRNPDERAKELNDTSSPHPHTVVYAAFVANAEAVERTAHRIAREYNAGKEWFKLSLEQAVSTIRDAANCKILEEIVGSSLTSGITLLSQNELDEARLKIDQAYTLEIEKRKHARWLLEDKDQFPLKYESVSNREKRQMESISGIYNRHHSQEYTPSWEAFKNLTEKDNRSRGFLSLSSPEVRRYRAKVDAELEELKLGSRNAMLRFLVEDKTEIYKQGGEFITSQYFLENKTPSEQLSNYRNYFWGSVSTNVFEELSFEAESVVLRKIIYDGLSLPKKLICGARQTGHRSTIVVIYGVLSENTVHSSVLPITGFLMKLALIDKEKITDIPELHLEGCTSRQIELRGDGRADSEYSSDWRDSWLSRKDNDELSSLLTAGRYDQR